MPHVSQPNRSVLSLTRRLTRNRTTYLCAHTGLCLSAQRATVTIRTQTPRGFTPTPCTPWSHHIDSMHTMVTPQPLIDVTVGIDTGAVLSVRSRGCVLVRPRDCIRSMTSM